MADTRYGVDYSWGRPDLATLKVAGYTFVMRYLSYDSGKNISQAEARAIFAQGMDLGLVWESTARRMLDGWPAGVSDGFAAFAQATLVDIPATAPIYFGADFDATEHDQIAIDQYLRGAAHVIGPDRIGIYGGFYVVKRCLDNGTARYAWQTLAWSGGQVDNRAHIYQNGNTYLGADVNQALATYFGQFGPDNPIPVEDDPLSALSPDEQIELLRTVRELRTTQAQQFQFEAAELKPQVRALVNGMLTGQTAPPSGGLPETPTAFPPSPEIPSQPVHGTIASVDVAALSAALAAALAPHVTDPIAIANEVVRELGSKLTSSTR